MKHASRGCSCPHPANIILEMSEMQFISFICPTPSEMVASPVKQAQDVFPSFTPNHNCCSIMQISKCVSLHRPPATHLLLTEMCSSCPPPSASSSSTSWLMPKINSTSYTPGLDLKENPITITQSILLSRRAT